jgi:hypothetical protein
LSLEYGKNCLMAGLVAGMVDGFLGLLYFAYTTGASLLHAAKSFWNSAWSYVEKLLKVIGIVIITITAFFGNAAT